MNIALHRISSDKRTSELSPTHVAVDVINLNASVRLKFATSRFIPLPIDYSVQCGAKLIVLTRFIEQFIIIGARVSRARFWTVILRYYTIYSE